MNEFVTVGQLWLVFVQHRNSQSVPQRQRCIKMDMFFSRNISQLSFPKAICSCFFIAPQNGSPKNHNYKLNQIRFNCYEKKTQDNFASIHSIRTKSWTTSENTKRIISIKFPVCPGKHKPKIMKIKPRNLIWNEI